jgi:membrane protein CcdC involved in cytochrome C biogenesis
MKRKNIIRLIEFFVVGLIFGILEDLLAIVLTSDTEITGKTILIASLVALPFAVFSELIVDHPTFQKKVLRDKSN